MRQKSKTLETTTDRKTDKVARSYARHAKLGTCPRCNSGRPCFIRKSKEI